MIPQSHDNHFNRCVFTDNDEYSIDFLSLCRKQKSLTFDTRYLKPKYVSHPLETPFHEIRVAFPSEHCYHPIINQQPLFKGTYQEFIIALKNALKEYLMKLDDNQQYLMFHSSGMDSRFISGTMTELRRAGKKQFKNVHFRCHQPEVKDFLYIMERQGWHPSQYSAWEGRYEDYYDIGRSDVCVQGWCSYSNQMNFWSDIVKDPKEWIVISGEGGELFKYIGVFPNVTPFHYCDNYHLNMLMDYNGGKGEWENQWMLQFKDVNMPLWSFDYLMVSNRVHSDWITIEDMTIKWDNIKIDLVKSVGLMGAPFHNEPTSWVLSEKRANEINDLFYKGAFYKKFGELIGKDINFAENTQDWNSRMWGFAVTVYDQIYKP